MDGICRCSQGHVRDTSKQLCILGYHGVDVPCCCCTRILLLSISVVFSVHLINWHLMSSTKHAQFYKRAKSGVSLNVRQPIFSFYCVL